MDLRNILNEIENTDNSVFDKSTERRQILKGFGSKLAIAAIPFAAGSLFQKAYAKGTAIIEDAITFLLRVEYMQAAFYKEALESTTLVIPLSEKPFFEKIAVHEEAHVAALVKILDENGYTIPTEETYDFTGSGGQGNGPFNNVFTNYKTFLEVAQVLEDLGVRAYKSQFTTVMTKNDYLAIILAIHATEARQAAHIRFLRGAKPWITGNDSGMANQGAIKTYAGENNTFQSGLETKGINGFAITEEIATEAFDEPMEPLRVNDVMTSFIVP
jgi:hypothetical protein